MDPAPTGEDGESHSARPGKVIGKTTRMACDGLVLAHVNTNAIEAAYRRSDLFERRRGAHGAVGRVRCRERLLASGRHEPCGGGSWM